MNIYFYAPDNALPAGTSMARAAYFRSWALARLAHVFPNAVVDVLRESNTPMVPTELRGWATQARPAEVCRAVGVMDRMWANFVDAQVGPDAPTEKPAERLQCAACGSWHNLGETELAVRAGRILYAYESQLPISGADLKARINAMTDALRGVK